MTTANVVDVSEWQPTSIDWANLKTNGVKAVVVRIGHGTTRDANAADHIANATKAGLVVHVYHYYEGVDGELQYSVNNAKSLNIKPNVYYFLDMEGTIAGSWSSIFESFRKAWVGYGWNAGLYCSLSNYAKFDDVTLVKQGVYRWLAAWGSDQPSNADMWQYDSKTGLGSYTSALDKDVDIAGKLIKEPDSTVVEPTDPNGNYTIKPGAFVGFDHSTTELQGGEMLVASPDGQNKIPKLAPTGAFLFNNADGDNMWALIKPKVGTIKGEKGDKGADGAPGKDGQTWQPYIADDKRWHIRLINNVDMPAIVGVITQGDANDLTMDDSYRIDGTVANIPSTSGLLTIRANSGEVWQTYIDSATADCYTRTRHNGTWSKWRWTTQWPNS
ncbi:GH25 family lysozyme [Limosilactobacillus mucosae]|uniref:GH25 family lysozyme n=1 Tax=Limosilactobacillus mucosae TaxID=97478 RepID=UPI00053C893E|nr:GH25 family lysozyme [Limosilactobacillus mucosae]